ncbi:MAG: hypothetical protein GAK45_00083 [Pseudomonas citronellolis]|nr:MAG: hypothetical protein GAK45_00083 [Pseudomonas citronellolis]
MESTQSTNPAPSIDALGFALSNRFLKGEAKIPQMPESHLHLRRLLNEPRTSIDQLVRVLNADPPLAAYLMQFADSPLLQGGRPSATLRDVLTRLGVRQLTNLVLGFSVRNLYIGKEPILQQLFRARWKAAQERAAYSALLAQYTRVTEADDAILAGLLQDVGSLPLLAELELWPDYPRDAQSLHSLCEQLSADIGVLILTVWKLPAPTIESTRQRSNWQREHDGPADLADLVQVAEQLRDPTLSGDALAELPALRRLAADCPTLQLPVAALREQLGKEGRLWQRLLGTR